MCRDMITAAYQIEPDLALALEGSPADNSVIVPQKMVRALEKVAGSEGIPYQYKPPTFGSTDAGAIHVSRGGVVTGVLSVPCRYIHSPFSTCRLSDFDATEVAGRFLPSGVDRDAVRANHLIM
jgi:hypothetical protein